MSKREIMKNNLKKFREEAELSLSDLGYRCGRSKSQLHQLENSNTYPRLDTAYLISKTLDKTVYEIWPEKVKIIEETIVIRRVVAV